MGFAPRSGTLLLAAILMPPKVDERAYEWLRDLRDLPKVSARNVNKVSEEAVLDGQAPERAKPVVTKSSVPFRLDGERLDYRPSGADRAYWSLALGGPLGAEGWVEASKSWYGFSAERREIFWLAPPYATFTRTRWTVDAEIVTFMPCDSTRAVLVENLPQGLTRFFFFRAGRPFAYTIFRLGEEGRGADVSRVQSLGTCQDFLVAGSFGTRLIQYSRW